MFNNGLLIWFTGEPKKRRRDELFNRSDATNFAVTMEELYAQEKKEGIFFFAFCFIMY